MWTNMYVFCSVFFAIFFGVLKAENISLMSVSADSVSVQHGINVRELLQRVVALEDYNKKQTRRFEELERDYKAEIKKLKGELVSQKDEISALRRKNVQQDRVISQLVRLMKLHGKGKTRKSGHEEQVNKDHLKTKDELQIGSGSFVNRIRRLENEDIVAFTAGLTKRELHMGAHQNIIFDHVETNVGNGYNSHHGVFTAPVSGLYVFYTSVLADNNREIWCELVVNGANKASVYARGTDGRHDQGSQALVIQLNQGDDVAVQNGVADDAIYGDPTIYSTFSGFLLQQHLVDAGNIVG